MGQTHGYIQEIDTQNMRTYRLRKDLLILVVLTSGNTTQTERHSKKLGIVIIIPHEKFSSRGDVSHCSVVNITAILKYDHVLFVLVPSAAYEPHPAGVVFIITVQIVRELAVFVYLERTVKSLVLFPKRWTKQEKLFPKMEKTGNIVFQNKILFLKMEKTGNIVFQIKYCFPRWRKQEILFFKSNIVSQNGENRKYCFLNQILFPKMEKTGNIVFQIKYCFSKWRKQEILFFKMGKPGKIVSQ